MVAIGSSSFPTFKPLSVIHLGYFMAFTTFATSELSTVNLFAAGTLDMQANLCTWSLDCSLVWARVLNPELVGVMQFGKFKATPSYNF